MLPLASTRDDIEAWCNTILEKCASLGLTQTCSESPIRRCWLSEPTPRAKPEHKIAHLEFRNEHTRDLIKVSAPLVELHGQHPKVSPVAERARS